ncbi:putative ww domain binding protein 11 protein [Neofusicoccum parvum UCRNP2]|uniref:Putative ww domain binding protein 11 protein n=1 Tax=Botryosphaeria parva (strain UCR-NP2) TaxID=1287680 RepID=R1EXH4_BOTPV|nr:putative ww domain binding protein 11 protein [Neofusicoccum parvum UCRNP2]
MAKDKSLNPVAAQHKADKQRALKKNKANVAAQRNERLAKRNPERLQRQIDELKGAEERGDLRPRDRETLSNLEKEPGAGVAGTGAAAPVEAKTVYSAAPVHRDLRKEASRFVPAAVAQKLAAAKGTTPGKLLEPEELDKLERQGYGQKKAEVAQEGMDDAEQAAEAAVEEAQYKMMNAEVADGEDVDIDEEAAKFERELKQVEMEEVEDEAFAG